MLAERLVDDLVLLELGLAGEFRRDDDRRIMILVADEIGDLDLGVGNARLDQPLDFRLLPWAWLVVLVLVARSGRDLGLAKPVS